MTEPKLRYVPLGGLGEVGLNMWALEWEGQVLVVDAGLMFPTEEMLGVDLVIPDVSWLLEEGRRVLGIFLTHGHEDHIGALAFVLKRLNVPVYGTRMTLGLARHRLKEHRILRESDLREVRAGDRVQLGPFRVETVAVCHSIPDGVALAIQTPVGRVVYTSDFKLDPDPLYGPPTDLERFRKLGDEGVLLLLSDSTNAERPGVSGKERDLVPVFEEIFRDAPGRIVVCTFASNIHRIQQVVSLAARHGRRLAVVGRSIQNAFETARELGHLEVPPGLVARIEDLAGDPRAVLLSAGSQGEPLSALSRFAAQRHNLVNVQAGDWVLLSARPIHVSGHAHRDELRQLLEAVRPRYFIPVHGEYRQLVMHAELAREAGIADDRRLVVEDGRAVDLTDDSMRAGEEISAGFVFVDGVGIGDVERVVLRDRRHLAGDGILVITVAVDRENGAVLSGPELISRGFIEKDTSEDLMREAREEVLATVRKFQGGRPESEILREAVRDAASRLLHKRTRRRPMVIPVVTEI